MNSRPSKHRRSVSDFLSEKFNKSFRRSPSPSASQAPSHASTVQSPLSPLFSDPTSPSSTDSASAPTNEGTAGAQLARATLPVLGIHAPVAVARRNELPAIVVSGAGEVFASTATTTVPAPYTCQRATSGIWATLETALRVLHRNAGLLPPLQSAIGALIDCLDILQEAAKNRRGYNEIASELTSLADLLAQHLKQTSSTRMSGSIANVARAIEEQARLLEGKRARGKGRRLMEANVDLEELGMHYRNIGSLFRQLQADATLSIWSIVNDQMANTRLKELAPVQLAYYNSKISTGIGRRTCTPDTRTAILSGLNDWPHDPNAADMYWMNGMAGTGKTTIACSFSELLDECKQLAASFFCARTVPECREATRIIPTIAYQLARYSIPFQSALCEALAEDPDISSKNITMQFERLLKRPLLKVKEAIPDDLVVVIDALDECNDMREVELLLSILLKSVKELPLKFFVTSRPEPEIYRRMLARDKGAGDVLHLHDVEKSLVQADIELYLTEELEFMAPTPAQIKELAQRSGNLFIYAATLVRYIRPGRRLVDPAARLESILAMTSQSENIHAEIDGLYTAVLRSVINAEGLEDREVEDLRLILRTAVCIQEPVGIDTIIALTGTDSMQRVMIALESLRSVIYFSETSRLVSTLHASFPDFMFDKARSKEFTCDLVDHNGQLTRRCFEVMDMQLHFNICNLESSFVPDSEVGNLEERVKQSISRPLWYACRYWADHLQHSTYSDPLCAMLSDFLSVRLLFWMEVLNLRRDIRRGPEILLKAKQWLKTGVVPADLAKLAEDARNFVTSFSANPVSESTPHIYLSSLPFCPRSSSVFKQYWKKMRGVINITGSAMQLREAAPLASWKMQSEVFSVAYSPDGSFIAVGCKDGTVSVRSAYDGALVTGPFHGHSDWVYSVAYSPDGSRIVSCSEDKTIRVWSVDDGTLLAGPFQGHTAPVWSVAYSPDGSNIVSGSADYTIRVWNADNGALVAGPFHGHTGIVYSVAYSPDGSRVVSGSADNTIRVWSAHNGALVAGPLKGHTSSVLSVAYSADGSNIASGSLDTTIRIWSAHNGVVAAGPLQGHANSVYSVAYSPDGSHIVSGSRDNTIRVWSPRNGMFIASVLRGHTNSVRSVAYSPDGSRVVSGSGDKTVLTWNALHSAPSADRPQIYTSTPISSLSCSPDGSCIASGSGHVIQVWSTYDGTLLLGPLRGHIGYVLSVAYSHDSSRIASGSADKTIQVWSAHDGRPLTSPFKGHTSNVHSVAYSPDGSRIASGSEDKTIRVWSARDGTLLLGPLQGHSNSVYSVAYSPNGLSIASGSADSTIRVWSTYDGTLLAGPFQGHTDPVCSVAYSPDGSHIVSGSTDKTIRIWIAHNGELVAGPLQGHTDYVCSVAYSPDGSRIVSGCKDNTIRVWSAHNGALLAGPFQGHTNWVSSVACLPDGRIVSGSMDSTIRIWRADDSTSSQTSMTSTSTPHVPKSNPSLAHWTVRHDRWVIDSHSQLLFWIPFELAGYLPTINDSLVIYPRDLLRIDHDDVLLGERWALCYKSE